MSTVSLDSRVYRLEQDMSVVKSSVSSIETAQRSQTKDTAKLDQRITDLIRTLLAVAGSALVLAVTVIIAIVTLLAD